MSKVSRLVEIINEVEAQKSDLIPKHKQVDGGLIFNIDITPVQYKSMTDKSTPISTIKHKRWSSVFTTFQKKGHNVVTLYHLFFDKEEFIGGATNIERSNKVRLVGTFKDIKAAKRYLTGGDYKFDLPQDKNITLHKQTPWTDKEMGI